MESTLSILSWNTETPNWNVKLAQEFASESNVFCVSHINTYHKFPTVFYTPNGQRYYQIFPIARQTMKQNLEII